MKLGMIKEVDWELIGASLANEGDDIQSLFFKALIKELNSWGTSYQVGIQLAGISHKLTKSEKETLSQISYIEENHV